jgi:hypothetical protein
MTGKEGVTLEEWLEQTEAQRTKLYEYGRSALATEAGERHLDMDKAIQNADDAGRLRADAESFLSQALAKAVLKYSAKRDEFTAEERNKLVRNEVRDIQRLVDGLAVTERTIKNRIYAVMNANRSR